MTGAISTGNLSSTETTAVRASVAKTARGYGSAVAPSDVVSVTQGLRFAYHEVECDAPAITAPDLYGSFRRTFFLTLIENNNQCLLKQNFPV